MSLLRPFMRIDSSTGKPLDPCNYPTVEVMAAAYFNALKELFDTHKANFHEEWRTLEWIDSRTFPEARPSSSSPSSPSLNIYDPAMSPKAACPIVRFSPHDPVVSPRGPTPLQPHPSSNTTSDTTIGSAIRPKEVVTGLFIIISSLVPWLSGRGQWWSIDRIGWMPLHCNRWIVIHSISSTLWLVLARRQHQQQSSLRGYHKQVGVVAVMSISIALFTGFGMALFESDRGFPGIHKFIKVWH